MSPSNIGVSAQRACTVRRRGILLRCLLAVAVLFSIGIVRGGHYYVMEESLQYVAEFGMRGDVEPKLQDNLNFKPDWTKAIGAKDNLFIYSAFLDQRIDPPSVRVLALAVREAEVFVECSFWTSSNRSGSTRGRVRLLHESHGLEYGVAFVECPVPTSRGAEYPGGTSSSQSETTSGGTSHFETLSEEDIGIQKVQGNKPGAGNYSISKIESDPVVRVAVSTTQGTSNNFSASIPVENLVKRTKKGELNVCVKAMHSNYNSAGRLVEFIELQRLLGADHFTFYNLSIGHDVHRVLQHYIKEGVAEVMPFSAPDLQEGMSYSYYGGIGGLNDCILRSAGRYPLVAVLDVDEFIVPRRGGNLVQLANELGHYTEYNVMNVFFYTFYNDDESAEDKSVEVPSPAAYNHKPSPPGGASGGRPYLVTQRKTRRLVSHHVHNDRSKYLCRPEKVYAAGTHFVHTFFEEESVILVPEERALIYHYRSCERDMPTCTERPTMVDRTMHRFVVPLTIAVNSACQTIFPDRSGCPPHRE